MDEDFQKKANELLHAVQQINGSFLIVAVDTNNLAVTIGEGNSEKIASALVQAAKDNMQIAAIVCGAAEKIQKSLQST